MNNLNELGLVELNETNLDEINGGSVNVDLNVSGIEQLLGSVGSLLSGLLGTVVALVGGLLGGVL